MSEKTLKTILGVVAVLFVLYAAAAIGGRAPAESAGEPALAAAIEAAGHEDVDLLRITSAKDTIKLRRTGDGWTTNGHRADSARVAELLTALREASVGRLASTNRDKHGRLGVADSAARALEARREGAESVRLLIGDAGPGYSDAYVRLPDRDETYLVRGAFRTHVTRAADDWRDHTILALDTAAVRRIEVNREDETYALERGDDGWSIGGATADSAAIADLLRELTDLQATGFAADADPGEAFGTVVALGAAGDTLAQLSLAEAEGVNLLATVPGDATVFELPRWRVDRIAPPRSELAASGGGGG